MPEAIGSFIFSPFLLHTPSAPSHSRSSSAVLPTSARCLRYVGNGQTEHGSGCLQSPPAFGRNDIKIKGHWITRPVVEALEERRTHERGKVAALKPRFCLVASYRLLAGEQEVLRTCTRWQPTAARALVAERKKRTTKMKNNGNERRIYKKWNVIRNWRGRQKAEMYFEPTVRNDVGGG